MRTSKHIHTVVRMCLSGNELWKRMTYLKIGRRDLKGNDEIIFMNMIDALFECGFKYSAFLFFVTFLPLTSPFFLSSVLSSLLFHVLTIPSISLYSPRTSSLPTALLYSHAAYISHLLRLFPHHITWHHILPNLISPPLLAMRSNTSAIASILVKSQHFI